VRPLTSSSRNIYYYTSTRETAGPRRWMILDKNNFWPAYTENNTVPDNYAHDVAGIFGSATTGDWLESEMIYSNKPGYTRSSKVYVTSGYEPLHCRYVDTSEPIPFRYKITPLLGLDSVPAESALIDGTTIQFTFDHDLVPISLTEELAFTVVAQRYGKTYNQTYSQTLRVESLSQDTNILTVHLASPTDRLAGDASLTVTYDSASGTLSTMTGRIPSFSTTLDTTDPLKISPVTDAENITFTLTDQACHIGWLISTTEEEANREYYYDWPTIVN